MRELTQTSLHPAGNCWQTAVACLLDLDPAVLPPQAEYDWRTTNEAGGTLCGPSYHVALNAYLRDHHGMAYVELHLPEEVHQVLAVAEPGWHMLTGRTVRSDLQEGARHVVVARYGRMVWDPHPSRAGLLEGLKWGLLIPFPAAWRRNGMCAEPCECPAHGGLPASKRRPG